MIPSIDCDNRHVISTVAVVPSSSCPDPHLHMDTRTSSGWATRPIRSDRVFTVCGGHCTIQRRSKNVGSSLHSASGARGDQSRIDKKNNIADRAERPQPRLRGVPHPQRTPQRRPTRQPQDLDIGRRACRGASRGAIRSECSSFSALTIYGITATGRRGRQDAHTMLVHHVEVANGQQGLTLAWKV